MVLKSNLSKIGQRTPELVSEALLQTGADVANLAKQLAPVDTGLLRQSIGSEPVDSKTVLVGTATPYSVYVEYGTSNAAAQAYLTPAFAQSEETFKARLAQAAQKAADGK